MEELKEYKKMLHEEFDRVIGFTGPKRAGKTTTARQYKRKLELEGAKVVTVSFASPIKYLTKYYEDIIKFDKEEIRCVYQGVGDVCRDYDKNFFVISAIEEALSLTNDFDSDDNDYTEYVLIIDDIRYYNEAFICHEVYYVSRYGIDYNNEHSSEKRLSSNKIVQRAPETRIENVYINNKGGTIWSK